jgi:phage/plasmid-associated DNA primase
MPSKSVTLKVDSDLYDNYRVYCKQEGIIVSRQFEKLMEKELKENGKSKSK